MTLDELRAQIARQIAQASGEGRARSVVEEGGRILTDSLISANDQRQFWSQLTADLNTVKSQADKDASSRLEKRQAADALAQVLAAAQAVIAEHQARLAAGK
jgi:hypothetical protein